VPSPPSPSLALHPTLLFPPIAEPRPRFPPFNFSPPYTLSPCGLNSQICNGPRRKEPRVAPLGYPGDILMCFSCFTELQDCPSTSSPSSGSGVRHFRITESVGLEGTFKGHLVQYPCSEQEHLPLDQVAQSPIQLTLNVSKHGTSTTSLGNPLQCFTTLTAKNLFLISSLNLPSLSLKPLLLVLSQQTLLKSLSPSFL